MLHLSPAYQGHLSEFLVALLKGDPAGPFRIAYGKDLDAVERDLRGYLAGDTISAMLFDIPLAKATDTVEVEAGASLFARLAMAELLSNTQGRSARAIDAYNRLAREFADRWEVEEAMGDFAWQERRLEDADRHFAKAEELGCRKGSMFLLWGRVLGYSNRTRDSVAALGKASRLLPESVEAQLAYGDALIRNGNWATAVATLRTVKSVPVGSMWRYSYNLSYGLYRLGESAAAKEQLVSARKYAKSQRENASLDQLEAALDRRGRGSSESSVAEGVLENVECGKPVRLHVRTAGAERIFVMPDTPASGNCGAGRRTNRVRYGSNFSRWRARPR